MSGELILRTVTVNGKPCLEVLKADEEIEISSVLWQEVCAGHLHEDVRAVDNQLMIYALNGYWHYEVDDVPRRLKYARLLRARLISTSVSAPLAATDLTGALEPGMPLGQAVPRGDEPGRLLGHDSLGPGYKALGPGYECRLCRAMLSAAPGRAPGGALVCAHCDFGQESE